MEFTASEAVAFGGLLLLLLRTTTPLMCERSQKPPHQASCAALAGAAAGAAATSAPSSLSHSCTVSVCSARAVARRLKAEAGAAEVSCRGEALRRGAAGAAPPSRASPNCRSTQWSGVTATSCGMPCCVRCICTLLRLPLQSAGWLR